MFLTLPSAAALRFGAALGSLLYFLDYRDRQVGMANLEKAFPLKSVPERKQILHESLRNLGRSLAEFCRTAALTRADVEQLIDFDDRASWEKALTLADEKGAVILTGHFGNWELLAYAHALLGKPVTFIHRPMNNPLFEETLSAMRTQAGTRIVRKKAAARAALRCLDNREIVVVPADQNQGLRLGIFVNFFGGLACTTPGPARLAILTGAPIIPVFLVRQGGSDRHRIHILPLVEPSSSGDRHADILDTTQRCSDVIEKMIRDHPEQWVWFHRRWKTRPPEETEVEVVEHRTGPRGLPGRMSGNYD